MLGTPGEGSASAAVVVSTDPDADCVTSADPSMDAETVQRAYDDVVAGPTGGTLVLDPAARPFEFDAPLDIWQSGSRVTATGGPTIVPAPGYDGPLVTSGLRAATVPGEDGMIANLVVDGLWLDGRDRATGVTLADVQLSTVSNLHVRDTDGPGLWLADACIENLFSGIVLSDNCGSETEPALLLRPESVERPDAPSEGYDGIGNLTTNSTHFSGLTIHFPTNDALRIGTGPTPVSKSRRQRKIQFTGCMFHGHKRASAPLVTIADAFELAFVGTQFVRWRDDGVVVQYGTEDSRWPVGSTTFSHCRFTAQPDSDAVGIRCRNVDAGVTSLQLVGNTFDDRLAHAVDWGDQSDMRAAWAANGVDVSGEAHLGTPPENADQRPFQ